MTATGSLPPIALEAVAIDCETTGLDAAKARLPEIAAVPLDGEHIGAAPLFVSLADPGVPIPPESNAVHGLDAAAIAGAPPVETVLRAFVEATGRRVVIGHSIGFDLAIINAECQRLGLPPWPPVWVLELGIGGRPDLEAYIEAQALLLELVLRQQLADIAAGDRPGNAIRLDRLERTERHRLKAAIKTLQTAPTSSATCSSPSLVPTAEGPGRPLKARADRNGRRPRRETTRVRRSLRLALPTHYRLCILS